MNKISVIMSVFNEENYLIIDSVESILNQSYENLEFIIVLDNPNNNEAYKLLKEYANKDTRVKLIINENNIGLTESLNKALKIASGEYIARMDADDISLSNRLEIQLNYMKNNPDIDLIASNAIIIDNNKVELYRTNNYGNSINKCRKAIEYKNVFIHPSWMFKKEILKKLIQYNEVPKAEDYDFVCRLNLNGYKSIIINECLLKVRRRNDGISFSNLFIQSSMAEIVRKNYIKANKSRDIKLYNPYKEIKRYKFNKRVEERYNKSYKMYNLGMINCKNKNYIKGGIQIIISCLKSKLKAKEALCLVQLKLLSGR